MNFKKIFAFGLIAGLFATVDVSAMDKESDDLCTESNYFSTATVKFDFTDYTAVVTGGTSGIGLGVTKDFLTSGANVVMAGRRPSEEMIGLVEDLAKNYAKNGAKCEYLSMNVSREDDVKNLMDYTVAKFHTLDFLVCSAGIGGDNNAIADETLDNHTKVIDTNVIGTMLCNKYFVQKVRDLRKKIPESDKIREAAIVNISSIFGKRGCPSNVAYATSKHAVIGLTKTNALDLAKEGIRVNCVCPAVIVTPLIPVEQRSSLINWHPVGRLGKPTDVSQTVLFLCSGSSMFATGESWGISGGFLDK